MGDGNVGLGEENIELPIDCCEQLKHQQRHRDNHQGLTGSSYWFKNNCKLPHNYGIHNGGLCMSPSTAGFKRYPFGYVPKEGNRVAQLLAKEGLRRDENTYLSGAVLDFVENEVEKDR
ncbi:hypothetical protein Gotri_011200 [Gossypium trilobum]|uniref:Uncharacterized protein n=1 Tax=Gossypium trilobum TaxID=34281 RepID=A0A7J9ESY1_9ROSI|nr:hypothetical protein [Gossypium trilobum]